MKVSSKVGAAWAVTVFLVVGVVLIFVALSRGGDETDMEQQPQSVALVGATAVPGTTG
ncbi:hypothetical protein [Nocardioides pantholopis]|uniref:hypothetical protein n=1 Tax=Nocardioides pantholopis TaxID=2483798 RepID=UPI0013DDE100|nr:hypothetical protein [Nocardioides pantholopis]